MRCPSTAAAAVPATREVASEAITKPAISVESTFLDDMARFLFSSHEVARKANASGVQSFLA
jgi:hypothetical protein